MKNKTDLLAVLMGVFVCAIFIIIDITKPKTKGTKKELPCHTCRRAETLCYDKTINSRIKQRCKETDNYSYYQRKDNQ